jgi:hypothetical protein
VAEGNGLLNRRRGKTSTEGSNPSLSATACAAGSFRIYCDVPPIPWTPGYATAVLASNSAGK